MAIPDPSDRQQTHAGSAHGQPALPPETLAANLAECRKMETELARAKEQLEKEAANTQKFMAAAEASNIPTIITTTEPKILYVNPA